MKAHKGVLYEYLSQVMYDMADAICDNWQEIYNVDDQFEDPHSLPTSTLLSLAADFCEEVENAPEIKRSAS